MLSCGTHKSRVPLECLLEPSASLRPLGLLAIVFCLSALAHLLDQSACYKTWDANVNLRLRFGKG